MFQDIMKAALILGSLGLALGALLALFSRIFAVHTDPRIDEMLAVLPNANCGGCGFSGCTAFAGAVVNGEALPGGCTAGGEEVAEKIAKILGVDADTRESRVAHVFCSGGDVTARRFRYVGVMSCTAASRTQGGPVECSSACLGYGDCLAGCPFGAISIVAGHAFIDRAKCSGCGKCVAACPRKIIGMVPKDAVISVNCSSRDRGAVTRSVCEAGCIGCTLCQKKCPADAITVIDNLARVDYTKCINCGECLEVCPRGIIRVSEFAAALKAPRGAE